MDTVNIGFGNFVMANRIVAVISPESAPVKRRISDSRKSGELIDATYGRKTRSVIILDSMQIVLSSVQVDTICTRVQKNNKE